ncbi:hypothetical protein [Mangrovimonas sp. YM274]|nr:hypothetical protein [Mangrovimonas sp. YM274]WMI68252.1 hypothetical protein RBH95_14015 [Mangrovimonas sp. YM274]
MELIVNGIEIVVLVIAGRELIKEETDYRLVTYFLWGALLLETLAKVI